MNISQLKKLATAALLSAGLFAAQTSLAQTASCKYVVTNNWGSGATANIEITNKGTTAINGWNVGWTYINNRLSSSWNANITGSNPYSASNLNWNGNIQPGQTVAFGLQVNANGAIETPIVTGAICGGINSSASTSKSSVSSVLSSSVISSSVLSSSVRSSSSSIRSSSLSIRSSSSIALSSSLRSSSTSLRSSSSIAGSSSSASG